MCCVTSLDVFFMLIENRPVQICTEIIIAPLFAVYYYFISRFKRKAILLAILFLGIGDYFLLHETSSFNLQMGVFFYWLMQLCLFIEFIVFPFPLRYSFKEHILGILFYGSYFIIFMNHVYSSLDDMKFHGLVYGITLTFFGSLTLMKLIKQPNIKNGLFFFGLLIFSVRDVLLTYNKRYFNEDIFTYPIPIFHVIGFYLILSAFLKKEEIVFSKRSKK